MKFNKLLRQYIAKFEKDVPELRWFNYKGIKKRIKYLMETYPDICASNKLIQDNDGCCICLERTGCMMNTFCCNNAIHYSCFIDVVHKTSHLCPLCRKNNAEYFMNNGLVGPQQHFDAKILEIISTIMLNIMNIEHLSKIITKNHKIIRKYRELNFVAVVKIAKKIHKYLNIDIREYIALIMKKNNILMPPKDSKDSKFVLWIKQQIEKLTQDLKIS